MGMELMIVSYSFLQDFILDVKGNGIKLPRLLS